MYVYLYVYRCQDEELQNGLSKCNVTYGEYRGAFNYVYFYQA